MKRKTEIIISNCYQCPLLLVTIDGYSNHHYECQELGVESGSIDDHELENVADNLIDSWFKDCPKWKQA